MVAEKIMNLLLGGVVLNVFVILYLWGYLESKKKGSDDLTQGIH